MQCDPLGIKAAAAPATVNGEPLSRSPLTLGFRVGKAERGQAVFAVALREPGDLPASSPFLGAGRAEERPFAAVTLCAACATGREGTSRRTSRQAFETGAPPNGGRGRLR